MILAAKPAALSSTTSLEPEYSPGAPEGLPTNDVAKPSPVSPAAGVTDEPPSSFAVALPRSTPLVLPWLTEWRLAPKSAASPNAEELDRIR